MWVDCDSVFVVGERRIVVVQHTKVMRKYRYEQNFRCAGHMVSASEQLPAQALGWLRAYKAF